MFQNAVQQAATAVDTAIALTKGETVEKEVWMHFELVTPEIMADHVGKN